MQIQTTERMPLLDRSGNLTRPSYAVSDVFDYNRGFARRRAGLKEWEFYQARGQSWVFQVTYGHTSYAGNVGATLLELDSGRRFTAGTTRFFPGSRFNLPFTSGHPHRLRYQGADFTLEIEAGESERRVMFSSAGRANLQAEFVFPSGGDAMVIATPMGHGRFYYNYKKNFLSLGGSVRAEGRDYPLDDQTFLLLDSGRGVWPYRQKWVWGNGTARIDGRIVGVNIGWGFGDLSAATENMLFVDGRAHKLGAVSAVFDEQDRLKPWKFTSDDGRFDLRFVPSFDNFTDTNYLLIRNRCHQVHGELFGDVVLDDGSRVSVDGMRFFCEHAENRW